MVFKPTQDGGDITFQFKENSKKVGEIKTTLQTLDNENQWTSFGNAHVSIDRGLEDIFYRSDFFSEHFWATPESRTRARRSDPMAGYKQDTETPPRAEFFVDGMASIFKDVLTVYDNAYYQEDLATNEKVEDNKEKEETENITNREEADTNGQMATTNGGKMEENDAGRAGGIQTERSHSSERMGGRNSERPGQTVDGGGETVHSVDGLRGGRELSDARGEGRTAPKSNGAGHLGEAFMAYAEQLKNNAKIPVGIYRAQALENAGQHAGDSSITEKERAEAKKQMRAQDRLLRKWVDSNGDAKTHNENNPERRELEKQLIKDYYEKSEYAKEKQAYLILGLPAAGKSSLADPLSLQKQALIVDSDEFKKRLPEFENGAGANYVHEESSDMADMLMDKATEKGVNIVYPVVGKTASSLQEKIDKLKEAGYDIHLAYVDLPVGKALERATNRYILEGRLVGLAYIESIGDRPIVNFHDFKNKAEITDYALYDNDVAFGESPILKEGTDYLSEAKKSQGKKEGKKAKADNEPKKPAWKEQVRSFVGTFKTKPTITNTKISPTGKISETLYTPDGLTIIGTLTPRADDAVITVQFKRKSAKVGEIKFSLQDAIYNLNMPQYMKSYKEKFYQDKAFEKEYKQNQNLDYHLKQQFVLIDLVGAYNEMLNKDETEKSVSEDPKQGQGNIDKTAKGNNNEDRTSTKGVKEDDTGRTERRGDVERRDGGTGTQDMSERGNHHSGTEGGMAEGHLEDGERETVLQPGENRNDRPVRQSDSDDIRRGVQEAGEGIQPSASHSDRGSDSERTGVSSSRGTIGGRSDTTGGDTGRPDGSGESLGRTYRDGNGDGRGQSGESSAPERDEVPVEKTQAETKEQEAQKNNERPTPETVRRGRFYSTKKERTNIQEELSTVKTRVEANKEAMNTYLRLTKGGTVKDLTTIVANPKDLKIMSKFSGWGGLAPILKEMKSAGDEWLQENFSDEEITSLINSTETAYFTPPAVIDFMWNAVAKMGLQKNARILEPSMGIGNFIMQMPNAYKDETHVTGIELDKVTGGMSQLLYGGAKNTKITVMGYEKNRSGDNSFDMVIGNVPFSSTKFKSGERRFDVLKPLLHDFFFMKAVKQTRPGGIIAFITTSGTMDKVDGKIRRALARDAKLIAAYRLPNTTFAGTGVVADIIFLQKKRNTIRRRKWRRMGTIRSRRIYGEFLFRIQRRLH